MQQWYFVRLWKAIHDSTPLVQVRIQAPSEGHAIVQVMKAHHLSFVARAYVSHRVQDQPTVRLIDVFVKGKTRSWRQEPDSLLRQ